MCEECGERWAEAKSNRCGECPPAQVEAAGLGAPAPATTCANCCEGGLTLAGRMVGLSEVRAGNGDVMAGLWEIRVETEAPSGRMVVRKASYSAREPDYQIDEWRETPMMESVRIQSPEVGDRVRIRVEALGGRAKKGKAKYLFLNLKALRLVGLRRTEGPSVG